MSRDKSPRMYTPSYSMEPFTLATCPGTSPATNPILGDLSREIFVFEMYTEMFLAMLFNGTIHTGDIRQQHCAGSTATARSGRKMYPNMSRDLSRDMSRDKSPRMYTPRYSMEPFTLATCSGTSPGTNPRECACMVASH